MRFRPLLGLVLPAGVLAVEDGPTTMLERRGFEKIWSDEFSGDTLDTSKWSPMLGDGCDYFMCHWGNNEKQIYTKEAITVEDGHMVITAAKGLPGSNANYTSGRLHTFGKAEFLFGRIEARIKLPRGLGLWPAFWMLPSHSPYGQWASSGEVDIMESCNDMRRIESTLHFGDIMPDNTDSNLYPPAALYACPGGGFCHYEHPVKGRDFSDDFNLFAVEWEPTEFRWYINEDLYCRKKHWYSAHGAFPAPYDVPFHIVFNLAMGGAYSVVPIDDSVLPQQLRIDYVRVYQQRGGATRPLPGTCTYAAAAAAAAAEGGSSGGDPSGFGSQFFLGFEALRAALLVCVPLGAALYLAMTGMDGLVLFKAGWNACNMCMSIGCGAAGGGALAVAFREATVGAASLSVFVSLAQVVYLRAYLSFDLLVQFGVPLIFGMVLGSKAVFCYTAPWLRPMVGATATAAATVLLARRLGLGRLLPMACGAPCMPAGRLQAMRERTERLKPATWCAGVVTGFLQGYAGMGAPLIMAFVVATEMPRDRWRACGPFFLVLLDTLRTVYLIDVAAWDSLWSHPPLLALAAAGSLAGAAWGHGAAMWRLPQEAFQLLVVLSLLACGVVMLIFSSSALEPVAPVLFFWALLFTGLWGLRHFIVTAAPESVRASLPRPVSRLYLDGGGSGRSTGNLKGSSASLRALGGGGSSGNLRGGGGSGTNLREGGGSSGNLKGSNGSGRNGYYGGGGGGGGSNGLLGGGAPPERGFGYGAIVASDDTHGASMAAGSGGGGGGFSASHPIGAVRTGGGGSGAASASGSAVLDGYDEESSSFRRRHSSTASEHEMTALTSPRATAAAAAAAGSSGGAGGGDHLSRV